MPRFSTRQFHRGNVRPTSRVWTISAYDDFTAVPEPVAGSGTKGAFKFTFRANTPTWPGVSSAATPFSTIGKAEVAKAGTTPFNFSPAEVQTPFEQYTHGVVIESKIQLRVIPQGATTHSTAEGLYTNGKKPTLPSTGGTGTAVNEYVYNPEAMVSLVLSNSDQPFIPSGSATSADIVALSEAGTFKRGYNTAVRYTRHTVGAEATPAVFEGTYDPKRIYQFKDLGDHLDDFEFETRAGGTGASNPTYNPYDPANPAYWTLYITGNPAGVAYTNDLGSGTEAIDVVSGIPVPHRVSCKITYTVQFYTPKPVLELSANVPLNAADADEANGGSMEGTGVPPLPKIDVHKRRRIEAGIDSSIF